MATYVKESDVNSNHLTLQASYMYGSQMLGRWKQMKDVEASSSQSTSKTLERGEEEFYFSNHLGNNLLVLSDRKLQHSTNGSTIDYYNADVLNATDYSVYGETLIGREFNGSSIKYGFNGKENDQDAGYQDYGMRMYSVKERRFLSVDPLTKSYPWMSPYAFAENSPMLNIDLDGGEKKPYYDLPKHSANTQLEVINHVNVYSFTELGIQYKVAEYGTKLSDEGPFNRQYPRSVYFVKDVNMVNNADYEVGDGTVIRTKGTNWHFWKTSNERSQAGKVTDDLLRKTGIAVFGAAVAGAAAPLAVAATPTVTSFAVNYGTQALTASAGSRLFAAGANTTFQYVQNAPEYGWGLNNFKHINGTSVGLSAINPLSIGVTAVGGNFGKISIADRTSQVIGGSSFSFKAAVLGSTIDYFGGRLGNRLGGYAGRYTGMTSSQSGVIGNTLSNAVTSPANIIANEATKEKNP